MMVAPTMSLTDIQQGDLLAWSHNSYNSLSNFVIRAIAYMTNSEFGHVGIAWRSHDGISDELFVVEATIPKIHISRATENRDLYCVPMKVEWGEHNKHFLMDKIGLPYSIADGIRAYFGRPAKRNDRWQCAELAHAFYQESGILLPDQFTPSQVVANAQRHLGEPVYRVRI